MKALSAKITKYLPVGATLECVDNTGAKKLQIITIYGYKGKRRTKPHGGVGNLVMCRVKVGDEKMRHQKVRAVIIRQRKEYRRAEGVYICFEDNAAVSVNEKGEPLGKLIKGPVAREAVERFPLVGKIANIVV
jgi:large subunit ribosomal protein L14